MLRLYTFGDEWMRMDHLRNYTDREKRKYLKENLSQCHVFHHKSEADWPGIERSLRRDRPEPWHSLYYCVTYCVIKWIAILFQGSTAINPYPTAFPYGNGMVLHFYQLQESSTTKTVHKVINKGLKTYV